MKGKSDRSPLASMLKSMDNKAILGRGAGGMAGPAMPDAQEHPTDATDALEGMRAAEGPGIDESLRDQRHDFKSEYKSLTLTKRLSAKPESTGKDHASLFASHLGGVNRVGSEDVPHILDQQAEQHEARLGGIAGMVTSPQHTHELVDALDLTPTAQTCKENTLRAGSLPKLVRDGNTTSRKAPTQKVEREILKAADHRQDETSRRGSGDTTKPGSDTADSASGYRRLVPNKGSSRRLDGKTHQGVQAEGSEPYQE